MTRYGMVACGAAVPSGEPLEASSQSQQQYGSCRVIWLLHLPRLSKKRGGEEEVNSMCALRDQELGVAYPSQFVDCVAQAYDTLPRRRPLFGYEPRHRP